MAKSYKDMTDQELRSLKSQNSANWHGADEATQDALHQANVDINAELDRRNNTQSSYNAASGTWSTGGGTAAQSQSEWRKLREEGGGYSDEGRNTSYGGNTDPNGWMEDQIMINNRQNQNHYLDLLAQQEKEQNDFNAMVQQYLGSLAQPVYVPSQFDETKQKLAQAALNMNYDDWTKSDQYNSLASRYGQQGKMTMQDLLGQIASRTGGLASSYATTAAQQQYNDYMAMLEEVARNSYDSERQNAIQNAQLAYDYADNDYQRYLDQLAQYNNDRSYAFDVLSKALENSRYNQEWANTLERQKLEDERYNDATAYERGIYDDETAYNREQATRAEAQAQVENWAKTGSMPSDALIEASGLDRDYVAAMVAYYLQGGTGSYSGGGGGGSYRSSSSNNSSNQTSGKSVTSGNKGNLDYDEDEGIFTWNGNRYNSVESLQKALNSANLTDEQVRKLKQTLKMYGFDT